MEQTNTAGSGLQTPFCGDLRSKQYFLLDVIPTTAEEYLDPSNHCWCRITQTPVGPDDRKVNPERCRPGRGCYKSAL
jgi:hypothetical protein